MQITFILAFGYGLLSFLSPCVLPLVPVYLASLVGPGLLEDRTKNKRYVIFLHSLSFVLGFTVVFTIWGAGAGLIGAALIRYLDIVNVVSGSLLIAFGVFMLLASRVSWLNYEKRFLPKSLMFGGYLRSFLLGAVFPIAWVPCTSWVLGGILLLAGSSQTAYQGGWLLAVYSLGLGLPFLILGAAFDFMVPLIKNLSRYSSWFYTISAVLLIGVGILVLAGRLNWLSGIM
jgi:cytochrome c-type biogenesis protein